MPVRSATAKDGDTKVPFAERVAALARDLPLLEGVDDFGGMPCEVDEDGDDDVLLDVGDDPEPIGWEEFLTSGSELAIERLATYVANRTLAVSAALLKLGDDASSVCTNTLRSVTAHDDELQHGTRLQ